MLQYAMAYARTLRGRSSARTPFSVCASDRETLSRCPRRTLRGGLCLRLDAGLVLFPGDPQFARKTVGLSPLRFASRWLTRSTLCGQLEPRQRCSVGFRAAHLPFCYLTVALTAEVLRKGGAGQPFSLLHTRAAIASPSRTRPHARTSHMLGAPLGAVLTSLRCAVATSAMWPGVFRPRLGRGSTAVHPASPAITCPRLPVRIPH